MLTFMEHENDIPYVYLKGNQVPHGMKQHMEAVNEKFEMKEIGM